MGTEEATRIDFRSLKVNDNFKLKRKRTNSGTAVLAFLLVVAAFFLGGVSPFVLGAVFLGALVLRAGLVGLANGFLGLILFIVYVGGTIVLFTYCFILTPKQT